MNKPRDSKQNRGRSRANTLTQAGIRRRLWQEAIPIGLVLSTLILLARGMGWLQIPELMVLDLLLKLRPPERPSSQVVLVGITENDLKTYGGFPLNDRVLTQTLQILERAQARAIGLDLFRDANQKADRQVLGTYLAQSSKVIGASVMLNPQPELNILPAPELSPEQVGFVDVILDPDHKLRRMILASRTWSGEIQYSLALRLAIAHLQAEGIPFQSGERSSDPLRFGSVQWSKVTPDFGGYKSIDANGNQLLLNFSTAQPPFRILSLQDVLSSNFDPSWVRDRVVVVGMTAISVKDTFYSDAVRHTVLTETYGSDASLQSRLYGAEFHAHAAHQIINHVLAGRSCFWVIPNLAESLLIIAIAVLGVGIGLWLQSPWKTLLGVAIAVGLAMGLVFGMLTYFGLWLPLLPMTLILVGSGLSTAFFDRDLRLMLEERRTTILTTYEAVHNGPLQTLAILARGVEESQWLPHEIIQKLQILNQELRDLYDQMEESALEGQETLFLQDNLALSLNPPLDQLLHQVYAHTLNRPFPGFESLLIQLTPDLSGIASLNFNKIQKRGLCLFLEEALCNVGKHGIGTVALDVTCREHNQQIQLKIVNRLSHPSLDPMSLTSNLGGQGTRQAQALAKLLGGYFERRIEEKQFICQLTWPKTRSFLSVLNYWIKHVIPRNVSKQH